MKNLLLTGLFILACSFFIIADEGDYMKLFDIKNHPELDSLGPDERTRDEKIAHSTGHQYYQNRAYLEAIPHLKKTVTINPKNRSAWKYLSYSYQDQMTKYLNSGDMENAELYMDSTKMTYYAGIHNFPDYYYFWYMLGYVYNRTGNADSAAVAYEKVVELYENKKIKNKKYAIDALMSLGKIYYKQEEIEDALGYFQQVVEIDPEHEEALELVKQISEDSGDLEALIESLEKQIENDPTDTTLYVKLIKTAINAEYFQKAVDVADSLTKLTKDNADNWALLGTALQKQESFPRAIKAYERAIALNNRQKQAITEIAICYANEGKLESAKSYCCRSISYYPSYSRTKWIKAEIIERIAGTKIDNDGKITYEGKFIYEKAREIYKSLINDLELGSNAKQRYNYLEQFIRTAEDKFMHTNETVEFDFGC